MTLVPPDVLDTRLAEAAEWLRAGGIVAFPTDTLYGLAADPTSAAAVAAIFDIKGRAAQAALPLIAASLEGVRQTCGDLGANSERLAQHFWPGPLSLVFDAPSNLTPAVHGGAETVAVRVPAHALARALAGACGGLITATSANRTGDPAAMCVDDLGHLAADARVLVIDGGQVPGGAPSTIIDARGPAPVLVREGAIAWSRVLESLQE